MAGKSVTLSSREAEYYSKSEIAKKVIQAKKLLVEIVIQIQFPINITSHNVGAIYLANNHCNSQRFIEWVEDNFLIIFFTPTLDNNDDILNKNPT
jgi:hypothetical protein